jgi:hypothetical protein
MNFGVQLPNFGEIFCLHVQGVPLGLLKMETKTTSEELVTICESLQRRFPLDWNLHKKQFEKV